MNRVDDGHGLLCVCNFPAGTGFAWSRINSMHADIADRLQRDDIDTWVAYPELNGTPDELQGSTARPVELDVRIKGPKRLLDLAEFVTENDIHTVYFHDRPAWHPLYLVLKAAGARRIVVHNRTSGHRSAPKGLKRGFKWLSARVPGMAADRIVCVSDFVADRTVKVQVVPEGRVTRLWNAVRIPNGVTGNQENLRERFGIAAGRPIIACACRATPEKGVQHLIGAFATLINERQGEKSGSTSRPLLVYLGDGPFLEQLKDVARSAGCASDTLFAGYQDDADVLVGDATLAVVPSVWEEAFGRAALEPMVWGVPVVASRAGGLPEVVVDGVTGLLVPPADEDALASAISKLLQDPDTREKLGHNAREWAADRFSWEEHIENLTEILTGNERGSS